MISKSDTAETAFDPEKVVAQLGRLADEKIDPGMAALALSALDHPGISTDRYVHHLKVLGDEVAQRYAALLKEGAAADVNTQLAALKYVLCEKFYYNGDRETYDDLQNASLIRVIDRAKGLPIALCILYMHAARAQGWDIAGLNLPGYFICRLEQDGQRIMFDAFDHCKKLEAQDLRQIVKKALGEHAELSADYYEALSNRDILMRLQNTIKYRQIEAEDYEAALQTVRRMRQIDPGEYRLLLDEGVLCARTERLEEAVDSLIHYIEKAPNGRDRMEAELLLQQLNDQLH